MLEALGRLGRAPGGERLVEILKQHAPTWLVQLPALLTDHDVEAVQRRAQGATRERMLRELVEALDALTATRRSCCSWKTCTGATRPPSTCSAMLARRREAARLLVVGTYRPADVAAAAHPLSAVKQELQLHGHCDEIPLEFLSVAAVGDTSPGAFPDTASRRSWRRCSIGTPTAIRCSW